MCVWEVWEGAQIDGVHYMVVKKGKKLIDRNAYWKK